MSLRTPSPGPEAVDQAFAPPAGEGSVSLPSSPPPRARENAPSPARLAAEAAFAPPPQHTGPPVVVVVRRRTRLGTPATAAPLGGEPQVSVPAAAPPAPVAAGGASGPKPPRVFQVQVRSGQSGPPTAAQPLAALAAVSGLQREEPAAPGGAMRLRRRSAARPAHHRPGPVVQVLAAPAQASAGPAIAVQSDHHPGPTPAPQFPFGPPPTAERHRPALPCQQTMQACGELDGLVAEIEGLQSFCLEDPAPAADWSEMALRVQALQRRIHQGLQAAEADMPLIV